MAIGLGVGLDVGVSVGVQNPLPKDSRRKPQGHAACTHMYMRPGYARVRLSSTSFAFPSQSPL